MIPGIGAINPTSPLGGTSGASGAASAAGQAGAISFSEMVASTVGHTIGAMRGAEQLSADALQGKADMRQVVDAVMSAEQSFQAAVAIRDKIVTAYLEVSRMAI